MGTTSIHTHGCRVSDEWLLRGMRTLVLENERIRVTVLLDRGAEIVELRHKPSDIDPLLRLPIPIHDPARATGSIAGTVGTFMDTYLGGWQEIAPSGGPTNTHRGAAYGQHGEVSLLPWDAVVLEDTPERVRVRCSVRGIRTPIRIARDMIIEQGSATLRLEEVFSNDAGESIDIMWGHHIAYGLPFLSHGARIHSSARSISANEAPDGTPNRLSHNGARGTWPVIADAAGEPVDRSVVPPYPSAHGSDVFYWADFPDPTAWYTLYSAHHGLGVAVAWDASVFRTVWQWHEFSRTGGFPWWGRTHAFALEPWCGYPTTGLADVVARGNQRVLAAGEHLHTFLTVTLFTESQTPVAVTRDGAVAFTAS